MKRPQAQHQQSHPDLRTRRTAELPDGGLRDADRIHRELVHRDQELVLGLRAENVRILGAVSSQLKDSLGDAARVAPLWRRIERHLFPALAVREILGVDEQTAIAYCRAFAVGFSVPVLLIDGWLDGAANREDATVVSAVSLIYRAQSDLVALPRGMQIVAALNGAYDTISTSALRELRTLYCLPEASKIEEAISAVESRRYYRSLCGYFSSVITGLVLLSKRRIDPDLREFLGLFGILRQIADDIADVDEDLPRGLVTLPVMYALRRHDLRDEIRAMWARRLRPEEMRTKVAEAGGFTAAYDEGMRVYEETVGMAAKLRRRHMFIAALLPFYELKFLLLRRLCLNGWVDSLSAY